MNLLMTALSPEYAKEIDKRVALGAKWLDKNKPGWEKKLKFKALQMDNGHFCVLGQLFMNHFDGGADELERSVASKGLVEPVAHYGFDIFLKEQDALGNDEQVFWSYLAETWIDEARARKAKAKVKA